MFQKSAFSFLLLTFLTIGIPSLLHAAEKQLPQVLIIGDSISMGYTQPVVELLKEVADVKRVPANAGSTEMGLKGIEKWLGGKDGKAKWDLIHFNWGLWDLCYRHPKSKVQGRRDKVNGTVTATPKQYGKNLEELVLRLKKTGAKLIWANITMVPEGEAGRVFGDDLKYNAVAAKIMKKHAIPTNDLNALSRKIPKEDWTAPGNVHFKKSGSAKLAEQVAQEIKKALTAKKAK